VIRSFPRDDPDLGESCEFLVFNSNRPWKNGSAELLSCLPKACISVFVLAANQFEPTDPDLK
jgi:hypothetical protein